MKQRQPPNPVPKGVRTSAVNQPARDETGDTRSQPYVSLNAGTSISYKAAPIILTEFWESMKNAFCFQALVLCCNEEKMQVAIFIGSNFLSLCLLFTAVPRNFDFIAAATAIFFLFFFSFVTKGKDHLITRSYPHWLEAMESQLVQTTKDSHKI